MPPVVCVTGVSGYLGSAVAAELLSRGYSVRGLVRFSPSSDRAQQLQASIEKKKATDTQLELVEADLLSQDQEPLKRAVQGCTALVHVASPFAITVADPANHLIKPAVEGTRNALLAAGSSKDTVKRVVVTSSVAAVHDCHTKQARSQGPDGKYSEADWNEVSTLEDEPYWLSKVLAEKEAWKLSEELGIPLTTILPNFVIGPVTCPSTAAGSLSIGFMKGVVEGKPLSGSWIFADVRDVAAAHVAALESPAAAGQRYIVSSDRSLSAAQVTQAVKVRLPDAALADGEPAAENRNVDTSKAARDLGLEFHAPEDSVADMAASLVELGVAVPAAKQ